MTPELHQGTVKAFDNVNWLATVQLTGSLALWLRGVPVSRSIAAAEMAVGRRAAVVLFDATNPSDAVVFAVWTDRAARRRGHREHGDQHGGKTGQLRERAHTGTES